MLVDRFTSLTYLVPVNTTMAARNLADVRKRRSPLTRLPETIVSDHDPKFLFAFWRECQRLLGTLTMSTVHHPWTDGVTERKIRTIVQILRSVVQPNRVCHQLGHQCSDWVCTISC